MILYILGSFFLIGLLCLGIGFHYQRRRGGNNIDTMGDSAFAFLYYSAGGLIIGLTIIAFSIVAAEVYFTGFSQ